MTDLLVRSIFRERLVDKGRFRAYLTPIPTSVIMHENPAFLGLTALIRDRYSRN